MAEKLSSVDVDGILETAAKTEKQQLKSIEVHKDVDPTYDLGNLLLNDHEPVNLQATKAKLKSSLDELARKNCQLLLNEIWKLPVDRVEDAIVAKLPEPSTILPRAKPIPKAKPPTKWEIYAKKKNIQNKKRGRMIWDETAKSWKPRFGYKRVADENDKWLMEVPDNGNPYEDQFEKVRKATQEKVAKNELQRLRNISRNTKGSKVEPKKHQKPVMSTELKPEARKDKDRLSMEIDVAKVSTASIGKFQKNLPEEKKYKSKGLKRKFDAVSGDGQSEKQRSLDVWNKVHKPQALDVQKVVDSKFKSEPRNAKQRKTAGKTKNQHGKSNRGTTKRLGASSEGGRGGDGKTRGSRGGRGRGGGMNEGSAGRGRGGMGGRGGGMSRGGRGGGRGGSRGRGSGRGGRGKR